VRPRAPPRSPFQTRRRRRPLAARRLPPHLPTTHCRSFDRLLFSVEQAWWHYEDHERQAPEHAHLASLSLKAFAGLIFANCPGLAPFRGRLEEIYAAFNAYKRTVPVRGAILLDPSMEKCLLVRGFKKDAGWGFPRGKLSKGESDAECAAREVEEETGLDILPLLDENAFIDARLGDQDTRLFIVPGVPESTPFAPACRGEIGAFGWHVVAHLPATWEEGKQQYVTEAGGRHKFFNVWPYVRPLRAWVERARGGGGGGKGGKGGKGGGKAPKARGVAQAAPAAGAAPGRALRSFRLREEEVLAHLSYATVENA
jgi:mRNA-decapping enzyme subunit 2